MNKISKLLVLTVLVFAFSMQSAQAAKYPALCSVLNRVIVLGDTGQDVRELQIALAQERIIAVASTGYFGPVSSRGVSLLQRNFGFIPSGAVGPRTLERIRALWCQNTGGTTGGGTSTQDINLYPSASNQYDVTVSWTTQNMVSCTIKTDQGTPENIQASGSKIFRIFAETGIEMNCIRNTGQTASQRILIRPNQVITNPGGGTGAVPTVTLNINPTTPIIGQTAWLYWTSTNATSCTLNGSQVQLSGSQAVTITGNSQTFNITCSGNGLSTTATVSTNGTGSGGNGNVIQVPQNGMDMQAYRGSSNTTYTFQCPANFYVNPSNVWGTDIYSDDSDLCTSALHAGLTTTNGGIIYVQLAPGQSSYYGSTRNNVTTQSYSNYWPGSFRFNTSTGNPNIPTSSISLNPSNITTGQNSTLIWSSTNATSCTVTGNGETMTGITGSKIVYPNSTYGTNIVFTINCIGAYGSSSNTATLYTNGSGGSNVPTITIAPQSQTISGVSTASVQLSTTNANACYLNTGQTIPTVGTVTVYNVYQTTVYTIVCTNGYGTSSANFTVSVGQGTGSNPTLTISPTTLNITSGQVANFTVNANNISFCGYTTSKGTADGIPVQNNIAYNLNAGVFTSNGTVTVNCTGTNGQTVTMTANVNVSSSGTSPTVSLTPVVLNITSGQTANFSMVTTNATYCTLTGTNGTNNGISIAYSGSNSVTTPVSAGTFSSNGTVTVNCSATNGQSATTQATVNVGTTSGTATMSVTPSTQTIGSNSVANFNITTTNVASCNAREGTTTTTLQIPTNGAFSISKDYGTGSTNTTTTYTFTCTGNDGSQLYGSASVVRNTTPTVTVTPKTQSVIAGTQAQIDIASTNTNSCKVSGGFFTNLDVPTNGYVRLQTNSNTTYTFTCNGSGNTSTSTTATVTVP